MSLADDIAAMRPVHKTMLAMVLDRASHGINPTCVRSEMCSTCPFAFSHQRLSAFHDCETIEFFQAMHAGGAIHSCHSRGKHDDVACAGFVKEFGCGDKVVAIK
jgi:hypothetical protein